MDHPALPPVAVPLTAAAGMLHLAAARGHLEGSLLLVAAFVAVGLAQLATAATATRWPAATREAIIALDLSAVGAWAVSRTVGLPLVGAGVEPVGTGDLVTVLLQLGAVVLVILPARVTAPRTGLASSALVVSLAAVALGAPTVGPGHGHAPEDGVAPAPQVVQLGPGDFEGELTVPDPDGAARMKELLTGAVQQTVVTTTGRVVGTPAEDHGGDLAVADHPDAVAASEHADAEHGGDGHDDRDGHHDR